MTSPEEPLKQLSGDLLHLLLNGETFSDVIFQVEGKHLTAHRCILAARSKFFRTVFQNQQQQGRLVIPVGIVGYEVFMTVLQFLYSGQLSLMPPRSSCMETSCWHTSCRAAVDFTLRVLHAAQAFGVEELVILVQKELAKMVEKASIEDTMKILTVARRQDLFRLWTAASKLVASSGLPSEILRKYLPMEMVSEIEDMRQNLGYAAEIQSCNSVDEQRTRRMQRALDSSDVELVKLMVMEEGLDLDKTFAVHYAVAHCSRKVMKMLLELGVANINIANTEGKAPLHIAAELADPEMIAVLLDHHADPHLRTPAGSTPLNILQALAPSAELVGEAEQNRLRLCLHLLDSATSLHSLREELLENYQATHLTMVEQPNYFSAGISKGSCPAWSEQEEVINPEASWTNQKISQ